MENTYYAHIPAQSTDGVYSHLHRKETTESSQHNTLPPPPTYSSLATPQLQHVDEQGLPSDYSVITQENFLHEVGNAQSSMDSAGAGAGTLYSTVVRQDGEKVTVKLETSHIHTGEEPVTETDFTHDPTPSVGSPNTTDRSHRDSATERDEGAQDMDYFDDPDILQQIRAQKQ